MHIVIYYVKQKMIWWYEMMFKEHELYSLSLFAALQTQHATINKYTQLKQTWRGGSMSDSEYLILVNSVKMLGLWQSYLPLLQSRFHISPLPEYCLYFMTVICILFILQHKITFYASNKLFLINFYAVDDMA